MNRAEAAQQRERLARELEADLLLVRQAHKAKLRALDVLVMALPDEDGDGARRGGRRAPKGRNQEAAVVEPPAPRVDAPPQAPQRQVARELRAAVDSLPANFTTTDVQARMPGVDRSTIHRAIQQLPDVRVKEPGKGRRPSVYEKVEIVGGSAIEEGG